MYYYYVLCIPGIMYYEVIIMHYTKYAIGNNILIILKLSTTSLQPGKIGCKIAGTQAWTASK